MKNSKALYNKIGIGYNNTRKPDKYILKKIIELLQPEKEKLYLDIGCGTGNYTVEIANEDFNFIGVDPSEKMLESARTKSNQINWKIGTAESIPAENDVFDGIIGVLTIHHWTNLEKAFTELYRTLKVNGKIVLFTSTSEQMKGYWLNKYFPKMLKESINQMPTFEEIKTASEKAGLKIINTEKYFIQNDLEDLFLYAGKNRPKLYLDENVRKGISSFANLSLKEEVEKGLSTLENDVQSNEIEKTINRYKNNDGDYLFIQIEK
ncbi:MAG: methyltransferase domain-containing protein [Flavobacteriales bacterium]|nr:methyltransferase domain-containing protein [Flavobacteriales bacterium]